MNDLPGGSESKQELFLDKQTKSIRDRIRDQILEETSYFDHDPESLSNDFQLIESGAIDSLGIYNIILFLEKEFGIEIGVEDLSKARFGTLADIENFVKTKTQI